MLRLTFEQAVTAFREILDSGVADRFNPTPLQLVHLRQRGSM